MPWLMLKRTNKGMEMNTFFYKYEAAILAVVLAVALVAVGL